MNGGLFDLGHMMEGGDEKEYKYDIFEAITRIREVEGKQVIISVPIPNKVFEFLRYSEYPYDEPMFDPRLIGNDKRAQEFCMKKLFSERIVPYFQTNGAMIQKG